MPGLREPFTVERFLRAPPALRPLTGQDLTALREILYEAASAEPAVEALGRADALALPYLARWTRGWGRPGDAGVVAVGAAGQPIGMAWHRLFEPGERGSGVVAWPGVPQVAVAVRAGERSRGTGSALLDRLMADARARGTRQLLLALEPGARPAAFARRHGFHDVPEGDRGVGGARLMVAKLG